MATRELVWTHDFLGRQTGVIGHGILELVTDRTLDGAETLTMKVPADHPKLPLLLPGIELRHRDTRWIIDEPVEERQGAQATVKVEAVASWTRLAQDTHVGSLVLADRTVAGGGRQILTGTPWNVGPLTGEVGVHQMEEQDITVLAAVRRWAAITGTLVVFDTAARTIDWVPVRGREVGLAFRRGRNIAALSRRHRAPTITELHPFGADGLTIAGVNGGRTYLEDYSWFTSRGVDLAFARSRQRRRVVWSDSSILSETDLLAAGQAVLDAESQGSETIELSVVDVSSITGVNEDLEPGDRVRALDPLIGDEFEATVTKVRRDWLAPSKGTVELSTTPEVVASPSTSSRPSTTLQWAQFTGRIGGVYRVRNDGIWTLARVALRFGERGQGHMGVSFEIVGVGSGVATVWIYDDTTATTVRTGEFPYSDGVPTPVALTAGIPEAAGRHDYRVRITTDADGGAAPGSGVNVAADPASSSAFWVMAQGAVRETPTPPNSQTFDFTGAVQHFVVPDGIVEVRVDCSAAAGGGANGQGGMGGRVVGTLPVVPGSTLDVYVGGETVGGGSGGWPGGGNGWSGPGAFVGSGGGGASFVAHSGGTIATAPIVAGGGGGEVSFSLPMATRPGGGGGLFVGLPGAGGDLTVGGGGATQFAGGAAASAGHSPTAGSAGQGGDAGGHAVNVSAAAAGGGGGGRFGGGGGTYNDSLNIAGGGGGGSGWVGPDVSDVEVQDASVSGDGRVVISWGG